jgi:hypothetical protein
MDCTVLEKPCTVIWLEDDHYMYNNINNEQTLSWHETLRSRIPMECGMSFASISFESPKLMNVTERLEALKASNLPRIHDAILIARGPIASLCAQYYLESFSLLGLVMVDPILLDNDDNDDDDDNDNDNDNNNVDRSLLREVMSNMVVDDTDWKRFENCKLLLEPNAVPMMVILATENASWKKASKKVADRHSDLDGLYGIVPVVDISEEGHNQDIGITTSISSERNEQNMANLLVDHVNEWVDNAVL